MSKIPDKPGWWWFKNIAGKLLCIEVFTAHTNKLAALDYDGEPIYITDFIGEWLGPCHKPGESFTVDEIADWIYEESKLKDITAAGLIDNMENKTTGIKAITERNEK